MRITKILFVAFIGLVMASCTQSDKESAANIALIEHYIDAVEAGQKWEMPRQILMVFIGCVVIYSSLFSIGSFVYGKNLNGFLMGGVAALGTVILFRLLERLRVN